MLLGGLEGAFLGLVATMFVVSLAPSTRGPIFASTSGHVVGRVMDAAGPVLPGEVRDVVMPFWAHLSSGQNQDPVAGDKTQPGSTTTSDPSIPNLVREGRSRVGEAVGNAVKQEIERVGNSDARNVERQ
jgi:membrane protein required for colicin V production